MRHFIKIPDGVVFAHSPGGESFVSLLLIIKLSKQPGHFPKAERYFGGYLPLLKAAKDDRTFVMLAFCVRL